MQGNGLARTLLRAVEEALQQAGVHAATMPAIIAAADEANVPPPAPDARGMPPELTGGEAVNPEISHAVPAVGFGAGAVSTEELPPQSSPATADASLLPSHSTLLAPHSNAWGCKVCARAAPPRCSTGTAQRVWLDAGLTGHMPSRIVISLG